MPHDLSRLLPEVVCCYGTKPNLCVPVPVFWIQLCSAPLSVPSGMPCRWEEPGLSPWTAFTSGILLAPSQQHANKACLCFSGGMMQGRLLAQADRKKAAFKDGWWVTLCFFQRFLHVCLWPANLQKHSEGSLQQQLAMYVWVFHLAARLSAAGFSHNAFWRKLSPGLF